MMDGVRFASRIGFRVGLFVAALPLGFDADDAEPSSGFGGSVGAATSILLCVLLSRTIQGFKQGLHTTYGCRNWHAMWLQIATHSLCFMVLKHRQQG